MFLLWRTELLILGHNASHKMPNSLDVEKTDHFARAFKAKAISSSIIEEHFNPHLSSTVINKSLRPPPKIDYFLT